MPKVRRGRSTRKGMLKLTIPTSPAKQCLRKAIVQTAMTVCEMLILMENSNPTSYAVLNFHKAITNLWKNYLILVSTKSPLSISSIVLLRTALTM